MSVSAVPTSPISRYQTWLLSLWHLGPCATHLLRQCQNYAHRPLLVRSSQDLACNKSSGVECWAGGHLRFGVHSRIRNGNPKSGRHVSRRISTMPNEGLREPQYPGPLIRWSIWNGSINESDLHCSLLQACSTASNAKWPDDAYPVCTRTSIKKSRGWGRHWVAITKLAFRSKN